MKKLTVLIGLSILITSCNRDKDEFSFYSNENCGIITKVYEIGTYQYIDVRNNVTDNTSTFSLDREDWVGLKVGGGKCFNNQW